MNKLQYLIMSVLVLVSALSLSTMFDLQNELIGIEEEIVLLEEEIEVLDIENEIVYYNNQTLSQRIQQQKILINLYKGRYTTYQTKVKELEKLFEKIFKVEATAYAPVDPNAVEGMCYSGDPWVTASGATSNPGLSVAMDARHPFGTRVLVEGFGERIVHDRGGAITGNKIDIMMWTLGEVMSFGRQPLRVIVLED